MLIFPAIDLFEKKAVRLLKGNYNEMTVYHENPLSVAFDFVSAGATCIHMVDLEGAKNGETPNLDVVKSVAENTDLFLEIGGGIRTMETASRYLGVGADRVILGTAAVTDRTFLKEAVREFGEKVAVGIDIKSGKVAIKGWTQVSEIDAFDFFAQMEEIGVKTVICTDISRDGAMQGTNVPLYQRLSESFSMNLIASGGVSSLTDVEKLRKMDLYGAIIGKAYYTGAIDLKKAIEVAK